jgi:hypothetical protein
MPVSPYIYQTDHRFAQPLRLHAHIHHIPAELHDSSQEKRLSSKELIRRNKS